MNNALKSHLTAEEKENKAKPDVLAGYKEAAKIDNILMKLLQEYPISEENYLEWTTLTRTVSTTIQIINEAFLLPVKFRGIRNIIHYGDRPNNPE